MHKLNSIYPGSNFCLQVEVIVNGIPSSCASNNCSFTFDDSLTPTILSLSPMMGQSGTDITIQGTGFSDMLQDVHVMIGGVVCEVTSASDEEVQCRAGLHSAGCYAVQVTIDGVGVAYTTDSICFQYLVTVDSFSPQMGGVTGGHVITFTGEGFLDFEPMRREEMDMEFPHLPWLRRGVGTRDMNGPFDDSMDGPVDRFMDSTFDRSMEPSMESLENFRSHMEEFYSRSPLSVFVGSTPCIVIESSITELSCIPLPSLEGTAAITITVRDQNITLEQEYTISTAATPAVQSITPSVGPVTGTQIQINGRLLDGSPNQEVEVFVGESECVLVSYNSTFILCTTSGQQPGPVPVIVSASAGIAVLESALLDWNEDTNFTDIFPVFRYELQVTGVSASGGSVFGGTEVSISGGSFAANFTRVFVGGVLAEIVSVTSNEIIIITPSSMQEHLIQLSAQPVVMTIGSSRVVTYRLTWSTDEIEVTVGDSITWNWNLDLPTTPALELSLNEVEPPTDDFDTLVYKAGGFSSMGGTLNSYTITFRETATHYFVTENNFNAGEMILTTVHVREPSAVRRSLEVYVGMHKAEYVPRDETDSSTGSGIPTPSEDAAQRKRRNALLLPEEECVDDNIVDASVEATPTFDYSPCLTPMVYRVEPQTGTRLTNFTITGERFSTKTGGNVVMFGEIPCIIDTQTGNTITCQLSTEASYSPQAFTPLPISLRNTDQGYGDARIVTPSNATVMLYPLISEITPREGSVAGGTDIIIRGDTFSFTMGSLMVNIDTHQCTVTSMEYSEIRCRTTASSGEVLMTDILFYDVDSGNEIRTACSDDTYDCTFDYSLSRTPYVEMVSPTTIAMAGSTVVEITGWGFSDTPEENLVYLGEVACPVTTSNETDISCEFPAVPAAQYPVSLTVCNMTDNRCFGDALVREGAEVVIVEAATTSLAPVTGSTLGGDYCHHLRLRVQSLLLDQCRHRL